MINEEWEKVIEHELDFLYNSPMYKAELLDRLKENELNIEFPVTRYDEALGKVYLSCPGTEEQALRRIETREAIEGLLDRISKRTNRLLKALDQLDEVDKNIVTLVYIERHKPERYIKRILGFPTMQVYKAAKKAALSKIMKTYEAERKERERELKIMLQEHRKEKVRDYLGIAQ